MYFYFTASLPRRLGNRPFISQAKLFPYFAVTRVRESIKGFRIIHNIFNIFAGSLLQKAHSP